MQPPSAPCLGLAHPDVTDQSPLLIGRRTLCPVYHAAFLPYRDQSSFPILPIHTRWLETAVYPRPMYGLRHAPCTGPARGLTHRRPPAPSSCCTGLATRLTTSPAASCLFTLHRPDFRRPPYTRRVGSLPSGFFLPVHADPPSIYIPAQPRRGSSQSPICIYRMKYIYISYMIAVLYLPSATSSTLSVSSACSPLSLTRLSHH